MPWTVPLLSFQINYSCRSLSAKTTSATKSNVIIAPSTVKYLNPNSNGLIDANAATVHRIATAFVQFLFNAIDSTTTATVTQVSIAESIGPNEP
jgi:hypothetical protein